MCVSRLDILVVAGNRIGYAEESFGWNFLDYFNIHTILARSRTSVKTSTQLPKAALFIKLERQIITSLNVKGGALAAVFFCRF